MGSMDLVAHRPAKNTLVSKSPTQMVSMRDRDKPSTAITLEHLNRSTNRSTNRNTNRNTKHNDQWRPVRTTSMAAQESTPLKGNLQVAVSINANRVNP